MERPSKRARISPNSDVTDTNHPSSGMTPLASLHRSITPPPRTRSRQSPAADVAGLEASKHRLESQNNGPSPASSNNSPPRVVPSPIQLTHIKDLPDQKGLNIDTVKLRDILGDPMIRECWQFNYLFDVDFLMSQFDQDVRSLVQVKVVHGSWEKEAPNRIRVDEACSRYPNVEAIVAYMPERFGTHHSKMMILLRHDDLAQVVIHTANMIYGDWANMTQGVWRSPLLPLQKQNSPSSVESQLDIGTGARFKRDLLTYLRAYGPKKTGSLAQQLNRFDFDQVRAALVASVPSKQHLAGLDSDVATLWGWPALKDLMGRVPIRRPKESPDAKRAHIVLQISSVASLGQTDKWLKDIFFRALAPLKPAPKFSIIFPTPDEIRRSLDGYGSGGSIHMKTQSPPQQKQLQYMRPHLCQWAGDDSNYIDLSEDKSAKREAGRGRAAPHIKTYIRFADSEKMDSIDWAMLTSANLSTQAWGAATNPSGEVRISSWEIGVVVWPDLFSGASSPQDEENAPAAQTALMVPCFKKDHPGPVLENLEAQKPTTVVGFRLPYDLPLTPYGASDEPWCATASHHFPDWQGQSWII